MNNRAIVPVKLSLSDGDFYTLWAPSYPEHGTQWDAFFGNDKDVLVFSSPAELLTYLESGRYHDMTGHPNWKQFDARAEDRVVPGKNDEYDIIGAPAYLADRPSYENVSRLAGVLEVSRALSNVTAAEEAVIFFASHSVLRNVDRGSEAFASEQGAEEWSAVGRAVLNNWKKTVESLDANVVLVEDLDQVAVADAERRIEEAVEAAQKAQEEAERKYEEKLKETDPYDTSPWAAAGIDPVRIVLRGKTVYTLRTYLAGQPVFLGSRGEIFTFPSTKQLQRWMLDHDDHDLADVSTWEDLVTAANSGELIVSVHRDNSYSMSGIAADIEKGPEAVDRDQMARAYELMADAADWAKDDSLNEYLLANPRFQDYLSYMLGSSESTGYVPSRPYDDKANSWKELEDILIRRFSKF